MNEITVIRNIVEMLEESYGKHFRQIKKVVVHAGALCNLSPMSFHEAYEAAILEDSRITGIELEIKVISFMAFCPQCKQGYRMVQQKFVCGCGLPSRQIFQQQLLRISEVVFS